MGSPHLQLSKNYTILSMRTISWNHFISDNITFRIIFLSSNILYKILVPQVVNLIFIYVTVVTVCDSQKIKYQLLRKTTLITFKLKELTIYHQLACVGHVIHTRSIMIFHIASHVNV